MADPKGRLVTPVAFNTGGTPYPLKVDANGYLKVVIGGTSSPSESMVDPKGVLVTPVAFNASGLPQALSVDANGYLVVSPNGLPPGGYTQDVLVYNYNEQNIQTSTFTLLTFNAQYYDTDNMHDLVTHPERLTCRTAGKYIITLALQMSVAAAAICMILIKLNQVWWLGNYSTQYTNRYDPAFCLTVPWNFAVNDYLEAWIWQNSGQYGVVHYYDKYSPNFGMQRIG